MRRGSWLARLKLALVALFILAAPTAGDMGSCGQPLAELDAAQFFLDKQIIDCAQCDACALTTLRCAQACGPRLEGQRFEPGCYPLVHDGEVCLRALDAAGCDAYRGYVDDLAPTAPLECAFCPPGTRPGGTP